MDPGVRKYESNEGQAGSPSYPVMMTSMALEAFLIRHPRFVKSSNPANPYGRNHEGGWSGDLSNTLT